jgi:hypothetical protein
MPRPIVREVNDGLPTTWRPPMVLAHATASWLHAQEVELLQLVVVVEALLAVVSQPKLA